MHENLWSEVLYFTRTQARACLFAILLLLGLTFTWKLTLPGNLSRYDFLFLYALLIQIALVVFRIENLREVAVIALFHVLATLMEWFKTSPAIGSWQYPAEGVIFRVYQVPLFAGFLYASVGSYIARCWRLFDFQFERFPHPAVALTLALLAYGNFFTHHFVTDIRWILVVASVIIFGPCWVHLRVGNGRKRRRLPLLPGLLAVAFAVWIAENIGTYTRAWIYPGQEETWHLVSLQKFWAWYLLLTLSFVLVSLIHPSKGKGGMVKGEW